MLVRWRRNHPARKSTRWPAISGATDTATAPKVIASPALAPDGGVAALTDRTSSTRSRPRSSLRSLPASAARSSKSRSAPSITRMISSDTGIPAPPQQRSLLIRAKTLAKILDWLHTPPTKVPRQIHQYAATATRQQPLAYGPSVFRRHATPEATQTTHQ